MELELSLVQKQLDAYNSGNIEMFLSCYSEEINIFSFPNELQYSGLDKMRERYSNLFNENPQLNCELLNRNIVGNHIIDQEKVTGVKGIDVFFATAIYGFSDNLISDVWFISSLNKK